MADRSIAPATTTHTLGALLQLLAAFLLRAWHRAACAFTANRFRRSSSLFRWSSHGESRAPTPSRRAAPVQSSLKRSVQSPLKIIGCGHGFAKGTRPMPAAAPG